MCGEYNKMINRSNDISENINIDDVTVTSHISQKVGRVDSILKRDKPPVFGKLPHRLADGPGHENIDDYLPNALRN